MSAPESTLASLRFHGDDLVHDKISKALKHKPNRFHSKGDVLHTNAEGVERTANTGLWQLGEPIEADETLDGQIRKLFQKLTFDLAVWHELTTRLEADVFCGIFLQTGNGELGLQTSTLQMLSERGLNLEFDIYEAAAD